MARPQKHHTSRGEHPRSLRCNLPDPNHIQETEWKKKKRKRNFSDGYAGNFPWRCCVKKKKKKSWRKEKKEKKTETKMNPPLQQSSGFTISWCTEGDCCYNPARKKQKKNMRDQKPIATGGATSALFITRELFVSGSAPGGDRCVARSVEEIRQLTGRLCQMVGYLFGWSLSLPVILSSVRVQIKWDFLDFI